MRSVKECRNNTHGPQETQVFTERCSVKSIAADFRSFGPGPFEIRANRGRE